LMVQKCRGKLIVLPPDAHYSQTSNPQLSGRALPQLFESSVSSLSTGLPMLKASGHLLVKLLYAF